MDFALLKQDNLYRTEVNGPPPAIAKGTTGPLCTALCPTRLSPVLASPSLFPEAPPTSLHCQRPHGVIVPHPLSACHVAFSTGDTARFLRRHDPAAHIQRASHPPYPPLASRCSTRSPPRFAHTVPVAPLLLVPGHTV
ncbi:unnamed protein product [Arctia plantaginis]|uniref:Uncharacterized protein n=1 Tax=Arctia plantaginis TaxID=874455 RepID=A0A8S1BQB2_ARCPL|nr:unnamed protein product [Arctia plantaginis]